VANQDHVLAELDAFIENLRTELAKAQEFRAWWKSRQTMTADSAMPSATKRPSKDGKRTVKDWIVEVLNDGHHLKPPEIVKAMTASGWKTTSNNPSIVVRNNLRKMEGNEVARDDQGRYYLPRPARQADRGLFAVEN
jgi:hypothetical protein